MRSGNLVSIFFAVFIFGGACSEGEWGRSEVLDEQGRFRMFWNISDTHIIIKLVVNDTGWVGVGFSDKGSMVGADIYVGWVKEGRAYITDRHGGKYPGFPPKDEHQDVELIEGGECNGHTFIVFRRPLNSCDKVFDRPITKNTMRVLYASHEKDPEDDDMPTDSYHFFRGVKSVLLLDKVEENLREDESYSHFSFLSNTTLERRATYYYCRILRIPELFNSTHHVVKIEPIVEHKELVHHMTLYECPVKLHDPSVVGRGSNCVGGSIQYWRYCIKVVAGWAVGGKAIVFPSNVGLPVGTPGQSRFFKLEIHYDDLARIEPGAELLDRSGFRFVYTPQLREHEAGVMVVGHYLAGFNLVVPPNTDEFNAYATCGSKCLSGAMDMVGVSSINLFNIFLHTHRTGRKISFRHFRNSTELAPISEDNSYDSEYQETRDIAPKRVVHKGDHLQTVCTYSNSGDNIVEGGLSIEEEMCASFIFFYPRIPLTVCNSAPAQSLSVINNIIGVKSVRTVNASRNYLLNRFKNLLITEPKQKTETTLDVALNKFPWTNDLRKSLSSRMRDSPLLQMCLGPQPIVPFQSVIPPLPRFVPYHDDAQMTCINQNTSSITSRKEGKCLLS